MIHILTNSLGDLLDLESEKVLVLRDSKDIGLNSPTHSASVLVQGIDEYTTKSDWN